MPAPHVAEEQPARAGVSSGWVWALVGVAIVARLIGLDSGLWIDEIYSLVRSFRSPASTILTEYWGDNHHPLYALLAHASRAAFGEAQWTVRLPAMLFGVATVPMLYLLGREVVSAREAVLASALLAVSYHHVWFSQNARGYSAIACLAVVCMWALVRGVRTGRTGCFVTYGLAAALGAYTHLTMVMVVVGHAAGLGVWLLMSPPSKDRKRILGAALIAFGLGAAATLVFYAPMLGDVVRYFTNVPSGLKGVSTPGWAAAEGLRVLILGLGAGLALIGGGVVLVGAVVGVAGVVSFWRSARLTLLLLAGAAGATVAGALLARGTMYPRFFFFAIGPALLIVVRGGFAATELFLGRIMSPTARTRIATGCVAAVIVLSAASLSFNYRYPKQDFEGAMRYVQSAQSAGDRVMSAGLRADPYRMLFGQDWPSLESKAQLDSARQGAERTWVVWTFPRYLEESLPEIARVLRDECPGPRVFRGTVGGGDVLVCALSRMPASGLGVHREGNFSRP